MYCLLALPMPLEDEQITSDVFNIPNSIDTQIFALESDPFKSSISRNNSCNQYLRENIGEPLSYALTYAVMYRPEDPIEFISGKDIKLSLLFQLNFNNSTYDYERKKSIPR